jgi:molybdate-binding protein
VETLFGEGEPEVVTLQLASKSTGNGARLILGFVREAWVGHPVPSARNGQGAQAADGFVRRHAKGLTEVELLRSSAALRESLLIAGCAPGLGVVCDRLNTGDSRASFRWLCQSNTTALRNLRLGNVHLAGVHASLAAAAATQLALARHLPTSRTSLYSLLRWEAGLVVAPGNPLRIRHVQEVAHKRVRLCVREEGSGARDELARLLREASTDPSLCFARATLAESHMEVAQAVRLGAADVGYTIRSAALAFGLPFLPLVSERFDLVLPGDLEDDPRVTRFLQTLTDGAMRRELDLLGYDASSAGEYVLELRAEGAPPLVSPVAD